ncbi:hypothetical protein [Oceanospirillum maris]|uniref:hypothetical protein n=1 Tax=Oceanospirillum maris TaxID=64977 RepID=UPI00040E5CCC|nr:hypothetical protein [Oceanospirillum maris]
MYVSALRDEAYLIYDAKEEGQEEYELKTKEEVTLSLIALAMRTDEQIMADRFITCGCSSFTQ